MKLRNKLFKGTIIIIAGLIAFIVGSLSVDATGSTPPWVRPDGTIDVAKLPSCFSIVGQDGNFVRDGQGKQICIPSNEIYGPPNLIDKPQYQQNGRVTSRNTSNSAEQVTIELRPLYKLLQQ